MAQSIGSDHPTPHFGGVWTSPSWFLKSDAPIVSGKTTLVTIPAYLDIGFAHSLMRMDIFTAVPLFANVFPEFLGHMMTVLGQTVYDVSLDQKVHSVYPQSNAFSICVEMMYIYSV